MKDEVHSDLRPYWSYRDDLAVIDDRQSGHEGQADIHTNKSKATGFGPTTHKPYGYKKKKLLHVNLYTGPI